jgi:formamidopyrimidine-DNA glycosylase
MPELPEVETVRRGLEPVMEGARFVRVEARRPDLRFPFPQNFNKRLEGQTVTGIGRRAKYLLADLSSGEVLLMHLGMSGSFHVLHERDAETPGDFHHARSKLSAHDHVVFHMSNGAIVTFNDPRRFGYMKLIPRAELNQHPMIEALGPKRIASTIANRDGSPNGRADALADAIKAVLNDAIKAGGSSLRDHRRTDGELGNFQHNFRVYDRAGTRCVTPKCKGMIKRIVQGTRSTFFCPVCQK